MHISSEVKQLPKHTHHTTEKQLNIVVTYANTTKLRICKTLIRQAIMYAIETWTLHHSDENAIKIFE